jgi:hypothetical protein
MKEKEERRRAWRMGEGVLLGAIQERQEPIRNRVVRHRRFSFPFPKQIQESEVTDKEFKRQLDAMRTDLRRDRYRDNVYADEFVPDGKHHRKKKCVSRRTQTYLHQLIKDSDLFLDDSDPEIVLQEEEEPEHDLAQQLIDRVLDKLSEGPKSEEQDDQLDPEGPQGHQQSR